MSNSPKSLIAADYQGLSVTFGEDGWFNATEAARHFGKTVKDWLRLKGTQDYIAALERNLIGADSPQLKRPGNNLGKSQIIKTRRGKFGGIWFHPKLAVAFARWLNVDFAVWCDMFIDRILRGDHPNDWKLYRDKAASSALILTDALTINREMQGKAIKPYHYMNEHKLVNWSMTGEFAGLDRDKLSGEELNLLAMAALYEAAQLSRDLPYEERKKGLRSYMDSKMGITRSLGAPIAPPA